MHLFTVASLKNRALIALVTIVAAIFGLLSVGSLKQELMPSVQFPAIAVVTSYPGASPDVVNNDVTERVETALRGVPSLESTTATSSTGVSTVTAQFTYGVDLPTTEQRAERAISRISDLLPETADPQVMSGSIDDFPVIQIAVTPGEGQDPEATAKLVERLSIPELSDLDGVREAQLSGARGDRVTITPNDDALAENGLSAQSVTDTLQQSGVLVAAGTVADGDRTLAVQAGSELGSAEDIAALPVARSAADVAAWQAQQTPTDLQDPGTQGPGGQDPTDQLQDQAQPETPPVVTIGEVAEVVLEPNPVQSISRIDGEPALTIGVTKMSAANTVDVSHAVTELLPELEEALDGAALQVVFDQAPYVEQSIETLSVEGMLGLAFAVIVILVFLMSMRATLVTAISIPTSVLITVIGLNFAEYSLNMLTLGALTISIGRVVDDSIVVIENIKRHLVAGADRASTIILAVREVAGAITASTVATMAVFLPVAFIDNEVGELFRPFSFTAALALAASLFVSLTIVPVLAYWFLKPDSYSRRPRFLKRKGVETLDEGDPERVTALQRAYRPIIEWTLKLPALVLLLSFLVFGVTAGSAYFLKTNFMGSDEQNSVGLTQTLAPGTSLDAQLTQAERVEETLAGIETVETVQVTIGSGGDGMAALFGSGGDGTISYSITTDPDAPQVETQDRIRAALDDIEDGGEFSLGAGGGGVSMSSAIEVNVTAPDQETLAAASEAVVAELQDRPGLIQVESDLAQSRPYLRVAVDRTAAAEAGLSEAAVTGLVAQRMQPSQVGQIVMGADTVSVYLSEGAAPADQAGVAALLIPTATGEQRLDSFATVEVADGPVTVRTENAVRMVTVSALPDGDDLGTAGAEVGAALEAVELPDGANANIGGVLSQQEEGFQQLGLALLAAILIVYVVMVATFKSLLQPLLLLVSVPFAATGAILLLLVTGIPLGVAALVGVLMLIGIVVTNAIVLIDLVNQLRERGESLRDAVVRGSLLRLRPIVMTALATILALTPMGLGITGKGGFISQPLAVVVIGGLLSSTVLTLIVLPTLYYAVERLRERLRERRARRGARRVSGPDGGDGILAGAAGAVGTAGAAGAVGSHSSGAHGAEEAPRRGVWGRRGRRASDSSSEPGVSGAAGAATDSEITGVPDSDGDSRPAAPGSSGLVAGGGIAVAPGLSPSPGLRPGSDFEAGGDAGTDADAEYAAIEPKADEDEEVGISDELAGLLSSLGLPTTNAWEPEGGTEEAPSAASVEPDASAEPVPEPVSEPALGSEEDPVPEFEDGSEEPEEPEEPQDLDWAEQAPPVTGELAWTDMLRQVRREADEDKADDIDQQDDADR